MADFNIFFATGLTYFQSKSMTLTTFIVKVGKDGSMNSWDSEFIFCVWIYFFLREIS